MTLTAAEIYDILTNLNNNDNINFSLADTVTESDVQTWLDSKNVGKLETEADNQIDRKTITDLLANHLINGKEMCICEVIKSHNDDPEDYESAYLIEGGRTIVQYKKRGVNGNQPITESEVDTEMRNHVSEMVNRAVNAELLSRAKTKFSG